ncbi:MAG: phenylalanine--tRNA ligase subunit alpha [Candidatus Lloydbacteria bacterium RIFCSPHIGHO2_01_FULL_41_20]|uniref:phenylalanine--tRNA ligase n=1 Tax=Candidatus Lloydbacteria bacterium RIFCSPHIGHO2_01_FULL_41_20 TaxID=1798657 RepID=A0A1G2CSM7_9BACT|nr:MAG: phenylalanine--tRNA ligase subunit alpha [Candidatus Lloydbacteria bacterium RIFCSPHIGHO2_01_FULL_41_20]
MPQKKDKKRKDKGNARSEPVGHFHPLTQVINDAVSIFAEMGFVVASGPEVETEHYNFDVLNIPDNHPARDMWDTFWLKPKSAKKLLRTHTSPVQARYMEKNKPPIRIISPGKTFRYEATDATHEAQFYQIEGLMIDKDITLAHLKGILEIFFSKFFGKKTDIRFRPSYFPFVEPGVEVDISCFKCSGKGGKCSLCKGNGFIEIMGAGMVHPYVLKQVGIDPNVYQGFAFGTGVDRLAMLKYEIDDIRLFYQGDLRLVNQF